MRKRAKFDFFFWIILKCHFKFIQQTTNFNGKNENKNIKPWMTFNRLFNVCDWSALTLYRRCCRIVFFVYAKTQILYWARRVLWRLVNVFNFCACIACVRYTVWLMSMYSNFVVTFCLFRFFFIQMNNIFWMHNEEVQIETFLFSFLLLVRPIRSNDCMTFHHRLLIESRWDNLSSANC